VRKNLNSISMVLLAGGFGTRVAHLLPNVPKPLADIGGRPFIEWVIRYFKSCGVKRFILSTGYLSETIECHFSGNPVTEITVFCRKELAPLGTAGGFLNAIKSFPEPRNGWLVANGDSLVVSNPSLLIEVAQKNGWSAAILGLEVSNASRFGSLLMNPDGTLQSFAEKRPGAGLINAGVYWLGADCRHGFPPQRPLSFEFDVFPHFIAKGMRIGVVPVSAPFIDIGSPSSLAKAEAFIARLTGNPDFS
jgi:D-glycero-alpha-D-manno-heptose 1-phosphate guanylyltransferase